MDIVVHTVHDSQTWAQSCSTQFRGLCVLYFFDSTTGPDVRQEVFRGIVGKDEMLAKTVSLIEIDGLCQTPLLSNVFGVSVTQLPTLVVYAPALRRYAVLKGAVTPQSANEFVLSLISGSSSTIPLSERPEVSDTCQQDSTSNAPETVEESGTSSDGVCTIAALMITVY